MEKTPATIAASVIATAALAACSGHASTAHGTVTGILLMVGGPALVGHPSGYRYPLPGHVTATAVAGEHFTISTGKNGRFKMLLPPGTYHLAGYSPRVRADGMRELCVAMHPVEVRADKPVRGVEVVCSVP
jgi:hypothetical protein